MTKVFISYRRADSSSVTGRINDSLTKIFGEDIIFKDVDDIGAGQDFTEVLNDALTQSDIVLVMIGRQWVSITDAEGNKRLFNEGDWVRKEVAAALARTDVTVIPVLVENAAVPRAADLPDDLKELPKRNVMKVRNDPDYDVDIDRLARAIDPKGRYYKPDQGGKLSIPMIGAIVAVTIVIVLAILLSLPSEGQATLESAVLAALENPDTHEFVTTNAPASQSVVGAAFVLWLYEGTGEQVSFYAEAPEDALMVIYNEDGEEIGRNDDCPDDDTLNSCYEFVAAINQTYAIAVQRSAFEPIAGDVSLEASTE